MTSMKEYIVSISIKNKEFNTDKFKQYEDIREVLPKKCNENV